MRKTNKIDVSVLSYSRALREVDRLRIRVLRDGEIKNGAIVYWMSRDQRVNDNWALLYAQEIALKLKRPLFVIFCLVPTFLNATKRQYAFMIKGLQEVEKEVIKLNINFFLLVGNPEEEIPIFIKTQRVALLVTDFDPLRIKIKWKNSILNNTNIPVHEVDAHNIVPCWVASQKQESGAYSLRPKILNLLPRFLTEFPKINIHPFNSSKGDIKIDYNECLRSLKIDFSVPEVDWIKPGENGGKETLDKFIREKLDKYHLGRNNPILDSLSNLSPYLHFGNIAAQRVTIEVIKAEASDEAKNPFLEQLIIRKELADNFCFYNKCYDSIDGAPQWARETLEKHRKDRREYIYDVEEFEEGKTHDDLWNAAQIELLSKGKIHSYIRMYWAKKILEWTESPEKALQTTIYLNDKYALDGRDPNGYTGIAWSILGVHDKPFIERSVFGKIRYMSYNGLTNKFDVSAYITKNKELKNTLK